MSETPEHVLDNVLLALASCFCGPDAAPPDQAFVNRLINYIADSRRKEAEPSG